MNVRIMGPAYIWGAYISFTDILVMGIAPKLLKLSVGIFRVQV